MKYRKQPPSKMQDHQERLKPQYVNNAKRKITINRAQSTTIITRTAEIQSTTNKKLPKI